MQKNKEIACSHCAADMFEKKEPLWKQKKVLVLLASFIALCAGLFLEFVLSSEFYAHVLYLFVIVFAGWEIMKRAWDSLRGKRFDMNVLMVVAAAGAFLSGHAEEGGTIIFLFACAEFLEEYAGERVRNSIAALLKLAPETARLKRNGKEEEVDVHLLKVGDIVLVKPGDRIPIDGTVVHGNSHVNEAAITGESVPSGKEKGGSVYAGTVNGDGYLEIRVTKPSEQTLVSKIAAIVENAQKQKSGTERFVDRFAAVYTPAVIAVSVLVATVPAFVFSQPFDDWFYRALVLLVTACPCALAISTPVSLVSGISSAAKNGILVKGGDYLEKAAGAKAVVLDKTGTLTQGVFEVSEAVPVNGYSREELLRIAASLEQRSTHPVGKAIMDAAPKGLHKVSGFASYPGKGITGTVRGIRYFAGNLKLPIGIDERGRKLMLRMEKEGKTVVVVASGKKTVGIISISDRLREGAKEAVAELAALGVTPVMLTGDNKETAAAIAKQVGISHFHAGLLPKQKLDEVKRLKKKYGTVMVVGDGVNDAPALAAADVGIAMGAIGSDVAIETADAAIMKDDLSRIPLLVKLGRKTMFVVKENMAASILVKGGVGVLALFGFISLWAAVAVGDMGLSLLVIANALRLGITKLRTGF